MRVLPLRSDLERVLLGLGFEVLGVYGLGAASWAGYRSQTSPTTQRRQYPTIKENLSLEFRL